MQEDLSSTPRIHVSTNKQTAWWHMLSITVVRKQRSANPWGSLNGCTSLNTRSTFLGREPMSKQGEEWTWGWVLWTECVYAHTPRHKMSMLLHLSLKTYQFASSNMEQYSSNMFQNHMTRRRTTPISRAIDTKFFCSSKGCFQVMSSSRERSPAMVQGSPLPSFQYLPTTLWPISF